MKMKFRKFVCLVCMMTMLLPMCLTLPSLAATKDFSLEGKVFTVEDDDFIYDDSKAYEKTKKNNTAGTIKLTGDMKQDSGTSSPVSFIMNNGTIQLYYDLGKEYLTDDLTKWHIAESRTKKVNNIELSDNMQKGVVIIQSSFNAEKWSTIVTKTNFCAESDSLIYSTKDIQLENGCFYRIIVAYKLEIKTGEKKIGPIKKDVFDEKYYVEEYNFFAKNMKSGSTTSTPSTTPRLELGMTVNAGKKEDYYAASYALEADDPHYSWTLGTFTMNGYTREEAENDIPVFLKTLGDKVTLWFSLEQDIECLNGDPTLSIAENDKATDMYFQTPIMNFKRGALIIQYTDVEGKAHTPIIYEDFLAADAAKGADTKVQLFEEGDYEVALDYCIKNSPRQIGPVEIIPTYSYYCIFFRFKIRNGNCMVFPLDLKTGSELSNRAMTPHGFKLDMAKSRYLSINVTRSELALGADGQLTEDVRSNEPAADNETYTKDGIYTFTVKNKYTQEEVTKTIYVGTNKYLLALSNNDISLETLNEKIATGSTISDDGAIIAPISMTETTDIAETVVQETTIQEPTSESVSTVVPDKSVEKKSSPLIFIIPVILVVIVLVIIIKKRKK